MFLMRPPQLGDPTVLNRFVDVAAKDGVEHIVFLSVDGAERRSFLPHAKTEVCSLCAACELATEGSSRVKEKRRPKLGG